MSSGHGLGKPLAEELVDVALGAPHESPAARQAAARSLFDFLGCVSGTDDEAANWAKEPAARLAVRAHLSDQDDLHLASSTHPGGIIWSVVTACASETGATWAAAREAAVTGYDVMVRLAEMFGSEHRRLWHATAVAGTVGAATAAAILLRCGREKVIDAVGHASSITSGSAQAQIERTKTPLIHRALAAGAGVAAARAAAAGLAGIRGGLDQQRGPFAALEMETIAASLQHRPLTCLEETGFRLHPATGFAHTAVDAALALGPLPPASIENVSVIVSPQAAVAASDRQPSTDEAAWWSIEHAVATCLVHGTTNPLLHGVSDDPIILRICQATTVTAADAGWQAQVEVTVSGGQKLTAFATTPFGHGEQRPTDKQLAAKFERLTGGDGRAALQELIATDGELPFAKLVERSLLRSGLRVPLTGSDAHTTNVFLI
jgi:2-methylcitrate dehydratase PrpD